MKKPELLAPAGGMEQLAYALYFGADAIYLACDKFGLRQRAQNFSLEELPGAVKLAHEWNARVFVTCNAYAHDKDLEELPAYACALEEAGVDAAIVSDLGVLSIIKQYAPSVALHISTQASVSNAEAAKVLYGLGARRIVCAREMSLEEIAQLKRSIPEDMEVEVFAHGAVYGYFGALFDKRLSYGKVSQSGALRSAVSLGVCSGRSFASWAVFSY